MSPLWIKTENFNKISAQSSNMMPPSVILEEAFRHITDREPTVLVYQYGRGVKVSYFKEDLSRTLYINPYSSELIKDQDNSKSSGNEWFYDTLGFLMLGHRHFWMPFAIGRPFVGVFVLIFVVLLLSGIFLWWPAN